MSGTLPPRGAAARPHAPRVRTKDAAGNLSAPSPLDYATTATALFTPAASGGPILGIYVRELRMAVDAVRAAANLGPYTTGWSTDYAAPTGYIFASYFTALQTALDDATLRLVGRRVPYSGEIPAPDGYIYAYQVQQIQDGVK